MFRNCALVSFCACALLGAATTAGSNVSKADKTFLKTTAQADMIQAHEGQLAANQATSQSVKDCAQKLAQDDSTAYGQLLQLASKIGESVPRGVDIRHDPAAEQLNKLKGRQFDSRFVQDEIRAEQRIIADFRREAAHGQSTDVKSWANSELPTLQNDLHALQALAGTKGKS